jgi:hypothetical protein
MDVELRFGRSSLLCSMLARGSTAPAATGANLTANTVPHLAGKYECFNKLRCRKYLPDVWDRCATLRHTFALQ